jgi:hypothetical protein
MVVSFLIGALLGIGLMVWQFRTKPEVRRALPTEWPLTARSLVNTSERRVWMWLKKVMFDQEILIKLPVTRFTMPAKEAEAGHWYRILNGVYCTFTLCSLDGHVIGCIDVAGRVGLTMHNQTLKHAMLRQLGMQYWVIDPDNFPHINQIRSAFLGEQSTVGTRPAPLESNLRNAAGNLQAVVSRQRHNKTTSSGPDSALPAGNPSVQSGPDSDWDRNSFLTPLDSRVAPLGRD